MSSPNLIAKSLGSLREAFGRSITKIAKTNNKIVLLDADLAGGTGSYHFLKKYPKRFFQCGIAEQNMIGFAAGLSSLGFNVFVSSFAPFICLRSGEQVRMNLSYMKSNVKIVAQWGI